ncbi:TPA: transition state regulator [Bacillus pseudomycoides]|nr:transition state regulator [Bacillus pseudomycoides]
METLLRTRAGTLSLGHVEGEKIILKKYKAHGACAITGEVSDKNITLADGKLTLSPVGAELIIEELQKNLVK